MGNEEKETWCFFSGLGRYTIPHYISRPDSMSVWSTAFSLRQYHQWQGLSCWCVLQLQPASLVCDFCAYCCVSVPSMLIYGISLPSVESPLQISLQLSPRNALPPLFFCYFKAVCLSPFQPSWNPVIMVFNKAIYQVAFYSMLTPAFVYLKKNEMILKLSSNNTTTELRFD